MIYPTAVELAAMGATLEKDVCLMTEDLRRWLGLPHGQAQRMERERPQPPAHFTHGRGGKRIA